MEARSYSVCARDGLPARFSVREFQKKCVEGSNSCQVPLSGHAHPQIESIPHRVPARPAAIGLGAPMASVETSDATRPVRGSSAEGLGGPGLKIFINYRHEDVPFAAMLLYRELRGRFGSENIFFDEGTLQPGMRFPEEIRSHLTDASGALIALIGTRWMPTMVAHRQRGDVDYVTKEIELALQNRWTVIPVLVDNAGLPDPLQLPRAIRSLPDCQAARLRQMNLDDDVEELSVRLNEIRQGKKDKIEPAGAAIELPSLPGPPPVLAADDEHYQMLVDEADNLVIFLGAGANADDHEGPFREGASMLPDDAALAEYLAAKIKLQPGQRDLAEIAQYVRMIRG